MGWMEVQNLNSMYSLCCFFVEPLNPTCFLMVELYQSLKYDENRSRDVKVEIGRWWRSEEPILRLPEPPDGGPK